MARILENATFDLVGKGWKPVQVSKVGYAKVATGDHAGAYRVPIQLTITEGKYEGRKLFESALLSMKKKDDSKTPPAVFARRKLEALCPEEDWRSYDFPESEKDAAGIEELSQALLGCEAFALVGHIPSRDDPGRLVETVTRIAPASADIEWVDDEEDEDLAAA